MNLQMAQALGLPIIVAVLSAWLTTRLSLSRFYSEKVWDRRAAAYTVMFDALHDMRRWFDAHLEARGRGGDVSDEQSGKLREAYQTAKAKLVKQLGSETWLISDACQERIIKMEQDLDIQSTDFQVVLDDGWIAIHSAIIDLRKMARSELKLPGGTRKFRWAAVPKPRF